MSDTLIGVIIGGLLTAIPSVIIFWLGKRSEERRHFQQLVMQVALENWKSHSEAAVRLGGRSMPVDAYVIHALKLLEIQKGRSIDEHTARLHIQEVSRLVKAVTDEIEKHNKTDDKPEA